MAAPVAVARSAIARSQVGAALVLAYLAEVAFRLILAGPRVGPAALPDEVGYLINARVISGALPGDPQTGLTYHGGYSALISPIYWFAHDPTTVYRLVLAENAVLSSLIVPLGYALASAVFGMPRRLSLAVAAGLATLPGVVFYSQWALADSILACLITAWLLSIGLWLRGGRRATLWAIAGALISAYTFTVHTRGLVVAAIEFFVLVVVWLLSRERRAGSVTALVIFAPAMVVGAFFNGWIAAQNNVVRPITMFFTAYETDAPSHGGPFLRVIGSLWTANVATLGLAAVALTVGTWVVLRKGECGHRRATAGLAILATLAIAVAAAANGADEHRVGNWAYSRYLSSCVPALIIVGIWALSRPRGRRHIAGGIVSAAMLFAALAVTLVLWAGDQLTSYKFIPFDFPETMPLSWSWGHLDVRTATIVVVLVLLLGGLAARWMDAAAVVLVIGVGLGTFANIAVQTHAVTPLESASWPHDRTLLKAAGVAPSMGVGVFSAVPYYRRSLLSWESYWAAVPVVWNVRWESSSYDAIAMPTTGDPSTVGSARAVLKQQHWRVAYTDTTWTIWVRARLP